MRENSPGQSGRGATADMSSQVVTLSLFRFDRWRDRLWAFVMMGLARWPIARLEGLGFFKLMGAGTGEGFTPVPDTGAVAILTTWPDLETADRQVRGAEIFRRYLRRANETCTLHLSPRSSRGSWSGQAPFEPSYQPISGPIAVLTRATIRPAILLKFWGHVPSISRVIGADPNVLFKIGVGEVPWFHQMTFSIWPDAESMAQFARGDGPHGKAIRAVREGDWFSEELYARFAVLARAGSWGERDALDNDRAVAAE